MRSVALLSPDLAESDFVYSNQKVLWNNTDLNIGLIEEEDTRLADFKDGSDLVLVKKKAFSCNFRDKALIPFFQKKIKINPKKDEYLFSHFGSEFCGEITELGDNVKGFQIGDIVIPNVAYTFNDSKYKPGFPTNGASKRLEAFRPNKLIKIPNNVLDIDILSAIPVAGITAYSMTRKAMVSDKPNSKILITAGKSNTSLAIIDSLQNLSSKPEISVLTSSNKYFSNLKSLGVHKVFVVQNNNYDSIRNLGHPGFDVIFDPFFDVYFDNVIWMLNKGGKYITCGLLDQGFDNQIREKESISLRYLFMHLMKNNLTIEGNCLGTFKDEMNAINDYLDGKLKLVIDSYYSLGEEHLFLEKSFSPNKFGKVIYRYRDD